MRRSVFRWTHTPRMKRLLCFALIVFAGRLSAAAADSLPVAPPPGSTVLWNGHDLTGWHIFLQDPSLDPKTVWSADGGVLRILGKPRGGIRSEKVYANYRLHVEWRWPAEPGNSGIFVHINGPDVPRHGADALWPQCVECQLKVGEAGDLIGQAGFDFPAPVVRGHKWATKTAPASEKPAGEWNSCDITCHGDSVEAVVNGVHQNRADKISATSGNVGLQLEGAPIEFRNVWILPEK